jgi:hypothetical protein
MVGNLPLARDMNPRIRSWALAMTAACATAACGDRMLTEVTVESLAQPTSARTSEVVGLLKRTEPLTESVSASAIIGPLGGQLQISGAGFRVNFPRGAVSSPTRITVTALRGDNVAYMFEPHGIKFHTPVTISQNLQGTAAWKTSLADSLGGSYFERLLVDPTESYARSLEKRPARLKDSKTRLEFSIEHFSGYMVSTGDGVPGVKLEVTIDITGR